VDILVDTNVILRRVHRSHPHCRPAREAILRLAREGNRICVTSQNLFEIWVVATRPIPTNGFGLVPNQAERLLAHVESSVFRLPDSDAVHAEWRRLVVAHQVFGKTAHDARLVAAMLVHGITHILTFNIPDFTRYPNIVVLDPISVAQKSGAPLSP
jgi:predicted nucleic acid-binding protein